MQSGPGHKKVGADLGLHHLGKPWAWTPSGELQTTLEHHYSVPTQLICHRRWRLVVSGNNQSLELTGLGKALQLTCQQPPRLNKRRMYSAHMRAHLKYPAWVIEEARPLDPTGHLLYEAMLPRQGVIAALPTIQKQTQGGCQKEETKKHSPNEKIRSKLQKKK